MNIHMQAPGPLHTPGTPGPAQFRSPTLSPRGNRADMTPPQVISSPLKGPSRRSQLAFPSFEPYPIGSVPVPAPAGMRQAPSYTGPGRSSGAQLQEPRTHSPRFDRGSQPQMPHSQMQRQQPNALSLQTPIPGVGGQAPKMRNPSIPPSRVPRMSNDSAPSQSSLGGINTGPSGEEVQSQPALIFAPSLTPRSAQPPPVVGNGVGPRRAGGSQPLQPHRQFASNVSPQMVHRETKPGLIVPEQSPASKLDFGDKENCENLFCGDHLTALKLQEPCAAANNDQLALAFAEQEARLELLREQEAAEAAASCKKREQEAAEKEGRKQKEVLQLQEERNALLERTRTFDQERSLLVNRVGSLEAQNIELLRRLQAFEEQHVTVHKSLEEQQATVERSLNSAIKEKQEELDAKDRRLHEAECQLWTTDVRLKEMERVMQEKEHVYREMECQGHDKDQTLQQMKHEHLKQHEQDASLQSRLRELEADLQAARQLHNEASTVAGRDAASERHQQEKEMRALWQKVQDQRRTVADLETLNQRTWRVGCFTTPGEFTRMIKSSEVRNGASMINARQIARITEVESLLALHEKENELHCRHLSAEVIEADKLEAAECAMNYEQDLTMVQPCQEPH